MRAALGLLALLLLAGCTQAPPPANGPAVTLTALPGCAGVESPEQYVVVRDEATLQALWQEACRGHPGSATAGPPNVDFSSTTVVGAFWGPRGGASQLRLGPARLVGDVLEVEVHRTWPATGCPEPESLTWPLGLARTASRHEHVRFAFVDQRVPC